MGVYRPMRVKAGREAQLPAPFSSFDELTGLFLSAVASPQSRPPLHPLRSPYKPHDPAQVFFESDTTFLLLPAGQAPTIPAYGRSGIRHERWPELAMRRLNGTWEPEIPMLTEKPQVEEPRGRAYECGASGAEQPAVAMKSSIKGRSQGAVQWSQIRRSTRKGRN